jgi:hypothetical protein
VTVRIRTFSLQDVSVLASPFLVVIGIGVAARLWYPCALWPHDLVPPLADAFIVAGIVGLGLELVATKFLIERVAGDLSERLVGRGLPTELQAHISSIVGTRRVRDHYVKSYCFSKPDHGRIGIEMEITFDVKNYSDSSVDYTPEMDEEEVFRPDFLIWNTELGDRRRIALIKSNSLPE